MGLVFMSRDNLNMRGLYLWIFIFFAACVPVHVLAGAWLENQNNLKVVLSHARADNVYSFLQNPTQLGKAEQQYNSLFLEYGLMDNLAITLKYLDKETHSLVTTYTNDDSQIGLKIDLSFLSPGFIPLPFIKPIGREKVGSVSLNKISTSFQQEINSIKSEQTANSFYVELADKLSYKNFNMIQSIGYGQDLFSDATWSRQHVFLTIEINKFAFGVRSDFFEDSFSGYREINRKKYISLGNIKGFGVTLIGGRTYWKGFEIPANTTEIQLQYRFD